MLLKEMRIFYLDFAKQSESVEDRLISDGGDELIIYAIS